MEVKDKSVIDGILDTVRLLDSFPSADRERCVAEITWNTAFKAGYDEAVINLKRPDVIKIAQEALAEAHKAGKEECAKTHFKPDWKIKAKDLKEGMEESYKAGIREVVEFVNTHKLHAGNISIPGKAWQAFLKSEGIK